MFSTFFDDAPDIAHSIPEPLKEDGAVNPKAPNIINKPPRDVHVNVNINTKKDGSNEPEVHNEVVGGTDTIKTSDGSIREWTEPTSNNTPDIKDELFTRFNYGKHNYYRNQLLGVLYPINRMVYNEYHRLASVESLASIATNGVFGIANIFGHILNLFRTGLFEGFKDFKRSELREYVQSNAATMLRFNSRDYSASCLTLTIDVPQGMTSPYSKTIESLFGFLDELNLDNVSKMILNTADDILTSLRSQNGKFNSIINDVYREYSNDLHIKMKYSETERHMTTTKKDKMTMKEAYPGGFEELKSVIDALVTTGNSHLQSVAAIHSRMEETEEIVGEIAKLVDVKHIDHKQLDQLSKIARVWAYNFDKFGTVINDIYRIDHNVTLNIKQFRKFLDI